MRRTHGLNRYPSSCHYLDWSQERQSGSTSLQLTLSHRVSKQTALIIEPRVKALTTNTKDLTGYYNYESQAQIRRLILQTAARWLLLS